MVLGSVHTAAPTTGLTEIHFIYVERSYFRRLELVQRFDADVYAKVEAWIRRVLELQRAGAVAPAEEVWQPEFRCRTCVYFNHCRTCTYLEHSG